MDRRTVLTLTTGASLSILSGCTNLRITPVQPSGEHANTEFKLGAHSGGWEGLAPKQIEGKRNPILRTAPEQSIRLTWKNLDGSPHRFAIENSIGETLVESEESSERGATRTVTFESAQEMTTYLDPLNPVTMRGELLVTSG
ncbi:hypothetical protein [Haloarcula nitratireducens]|uniref:Uncharacterized protein n=1 Tax=Haloarcula nitratireducens TaxID=2487749 RepID=A0AAW4PFU0_9EURY|nr:hypothetical protein [Halomicroarcula nitratireducens]MBX0296746.1 hypothetical protein [Halomicroarcula nitratireducens]